jgi:probable HAF family extracellular repeat protein
MRFPSQTILLSVTRLAALLAPEGKGWLRMWLCGIVLLVATARRGEAGYIITDLGTLPGYDSFYAYGTNASGQVVGVAKSNTLLPRAFLYSNGMMQDLGTLGFESGARAINDAGQIVGFSANASGFGHAFLYTQGAMKDLGTLGGINSDALAINNAGQVVGMADTARGDQHAFLYSGGVMQDLGALLGTSISYAQGINDSGQIVGRSGAHAFLYSGGVVQDLGTLQGGPQSTAYAINNAGQVVGDSLLPNLNFHAFLYSSGSMQDLGIIPGFQQSFARGINNRGEVVGLLSGDAPDSTRAFLYRNGSMVDLNSLLPSNSGWVLEYAWSINDAGQISGSGFLNGERRAFLLSPEEVVAVPEPSSLVLVLTAFLPLILITWRRHTHSP